MLSKWDGLWAAVASSMVVLLTSCAPPASTASTKSSTVSSNAIVPATAPAGNLGSFLIPSSNNNPTPVPTVAPVVITAPVLTYEVSGVGNQARHICVPAMTKLQLRIIPHTNFDPLFPVNTQLVHPDGSLVYDGTPAFYNFLRVTAKFNSTTYYATLQANNDAASVVADFSSRLYRNLIASNATTATAKITATTATATSAALATQTTTAITAIKYVPLKSSPEPPLNVSLAPNTPSVLSPLVFIYIPTNGNPPIGNDPTRLMNTPEYKDTYIYGSDPNDGLCTYWERQLGTCSNTSTSLRGSESATCGAGEEKILFSNIISDFPCMNDKIGWCKGSTSQYVTDYQRWSLTVQVATDATRSF